MPCGSGVQRSHELMQDTGGAPVPSPGSLCFSPEVHKDEAKLDQALLRQTWKWRAWLMKRDGKSLSCLGQQKNRGSGVINPMSVDQHREGVTIRGIARTVTLGWTATLARPNGTERAESSQQLVYFIYRTCDGLNKVATIHISCVR